VYNHPNKKEYNQMNIQQAAELAGTCRHTVMEAAKADAFAAEKPNGNRGGWRIDPASFKDWLTRRRLKRANGPARAAIKRGQL
jgi:hypothetical protein